MKDVFPLNRNSFYNTRNKRAFHSRHIRTVHFGSETLSHLALEIWELVPEEIKKLETFASFKNAIKKMETDKLSLPLMPNIYILGWLCVITL